MRYRIQRIEISLFLHQLFEFAKFCDTAVFQGFPGRILCSPAALGLGVLYGVFTMLSQMLFIRATEYAATAVCSLIYSMGFVLPTPLSAEVSDDGAITAVGSVRLHRPMRINIFRAYTDNDRREKENWVCFEGYEQVVDSIKQEGNRTVYTGRLARNGMKSPVQFALSVEAFADGVDIGLQYEVSSYIKYLP